jgi:hypothetical protein
MRYHPYTEKHHRLKINHSNLFTSVVDPDPYFFESPGSESIIICTDPYPDPYQNGKDTQNCSFI